MANALDLHLIKRINPAVVWKSLLKLVPYPSQGDSTFKLAQNKQVEIKSLHTLHRKKKKKTPDK